MIPTTLPIHLYLMHAAFGLPLALGFYLGDVIGTLLLVGLLRLVVNHHVTFFINSLAHMWGKQPYTDENSAKDNWFLSIFTYGEGYHNFHHLFQSDYRNGVRWFAIDLNKWFIATAAGFGLARDLRRTPQFKILRARLHMDFKRARERLDAALRRVENMESYVTSRQFDLNKELSRL